MGDEVEQPMSELFAQGVKAVSNSLIERGTLNITVWLGLIFLKTHLKDRLLSFHLDRRRGQQAIADDYDWEPLHHLHSVVRCFYTGASISNRALGTFMQLPTAHLAGEERFDFADLYLSQTMLMRLDKQAFVTVFNDARGAYSYFVQKLQRFSGALNAVQLREVMAEVASLNIHLKNRPKFISLFDFENHTHQIDVELPPLELEKWDPRVCGRLLEHALKGIHPFPSVAGFSHEEVVEAIREGRFTFLFDDNNNFIPGDSIIRSGAPGGRSK